MMKMMQFVGIAKSNCNLTRSSKEAREMLQQILVVSQDKQRIGIIGAICPTKFDEQLEKDIEYLFNDNYKIILSYSKINKDIIDKS